MITLPPNLIGPQGQPQGPKPSESDLLMAASEMHSEGRFDQSGQDDMKPYYDYLAKKDPSPTPPVAFMRAGKYIKTGDLSGVEPSKNIQKGDEGPEMSVDDMVKNLHSLQSARKEYEGSSLSEKLSPKDVDFYKIHLQRLMEIANEPTPMPRKRPRGR